MDTESLVPLIETDDFYEEFKNNVKERCDTLNYDEGRRKRSLLVRKNKKVISLMKLMQGGKIVAKFEVPRANAYACKVQKDDHEIKESEIQKAKRVQNLLL